MEAVTDEAQFFILHFEDKDYFGSTNIGRALVDMTRLLVNVENKLNHGKSTYWFPIIYQNK
jgi:hypothetical protein